MVDGKWYVLGSVLIVDDGLAPVACRWCLLYDK